MTDPAAPTRMSAAAPGANEQITRSFKDAMANIASGVTIVTADDGTQAYGATISSFTSVSLDPLLILFCLNTTSRLHAPLDRAGQFNVHVLAEGQQALAELFAFGPLEERTASLERAPGRAPEIAGTQAQFSCRIWEKHPAGDHVIVIGEVSAVRFDPDKAPLIWWRRQLGKHHLTPLA
ncbi:MAG: flavin reductase family protein [Neomegalonema sp.]|nr:flavin reductase family protein [Neomegalonema sp.]